MFEKKDREIKELLANVSLLETRKAGTTNWRKLSSWTEEYIDNGRNYTSCINW